VTDGVEFPDGGGIVSGEERIICQEECQKGSDKEQKM
jgi:hypothetical protein